MKRNYAIDFEFIEGFHQPFMGKKRHFIDMISVGIAAEDGRTYYAISNEFNPADADQWVRENVLTKIVVEWVHSYSGDQRNSILSRIGNKNLDESVRMMQKEIGKSNKEIAAEIIAFCKQDESDKVSFFGYYSDYDWVLFCSLFGRMIDLPEGFPMYCVDLKQTLDEACKTVYPFTIKDENNVVEHVSPAIQGLSRHPKYPKNKSEHNALSDALWNLELKKFLKSIM